ncbi:hypothetical protein H257_06535 [Aphanomyces astaci]|uniref:Uncharacterized protein n=1 Tax=Aphanomyces astaci TaxID=112090 RepID=W4GKF7_APHAT|nr:hypothetical protein H257_06535 [Aphanomyces astaci]ETV80170.1 hypothetical protein H257_06535 [Aphanomyces astaci]|eukprot:XP_009830094.1 hypothetical protein H257_06535 [Aphanomyces astaci]
MDDWTNGLGSRVGHVGSSPINKRLSGCHVIGTGLTVKIGMACIMLRKSALDLGSAVVACATVLKTARAIDLGVGTKNKSMSPVVTKLGSGNMVRRHLRTHFWLGVPRGVARPAALVVDRVDQVVVVAMAAHLEYKMCSFHGPHVIMNVDHATFLS